MNRILLGLGGVGAMVLVAVGCSSSDNNNNNAGVDSGADTGTKKDSAVVVVDSDTTPACYAGTAARFTQATDPTVFGYHAAMPRAGGCVAGDGKKFLDGLIALGDAFVSTEYDTSKVTTISESCRACIVSEYNQAGENTEARKWGISGLRVDATGANYVFPSSYELFNYNGCAEAAGIITTAEAKAMNDLETCLSLSCPKTANGCGADDDSGTATEEFSACAEFALQEGICAPLAAPAQAAYTKSQPAFKTGGPCANGPAITETFCAYSTTVLDGGTGTTDAAVVVDAAVSTDAAAATN